MRNHMSDRFGKVYNFHECPPLPKSLNIELNNTCNQKCIFCPYHGEHAITKLMPAMIKFENVVKILDEAKHLGIGEKEVGFYLAGEAFLYKDLDKVVRYAKSLGFQYVFLTTNGALATPDKMKKILDAGIDSIRISINAADKETYNYLHGKDDFEVVCNNVRFMHDYIMENKLKVATSISCVWTKKTIEIRESFKNLFGKYVDDIIFIPVMMSWLSYDEAFWKEIQLIDDSKAEINEDFVCPMLFDTMYINANMQVVPCCDAYHGDISFFDLKEELNLEKAWNSEIASIYRNIFLKHTDDTETICKNCLLRKKGLDRFLLD